MEALHLEIDSGLLREFAQEALEMLDQIEPGLVALSTSASEPQGDSELVHQVFRAFHSMKGSAGFMNLSATQRLTHECESLLDYVRVGKAALDGHRIDLILQTCDLLRGILERAAREGHDRFAEPDVERIIQRLRAEIAARPHQGAPAAPSALALPLAPGADPRPPARQALEQARSLLRGPLEPASPPSGALGEALRTLAAACERSRRAELGRVASGLAELAGASIPLSPDRLSLIAGVLEALASLLEEDKGVSAPGADALLDLIEEAMPAPLPAPRRQGEPKAAAPAQIAPSPPGAPAEGRREPARILAGEPSQPGATRQPQEEPAPQAPPPMSGAAASPAPGGALARASIRVDSERLDGLVDLVGELIIAQSMLPRFGAPHSSEHETFEAAAAQLSKITRDLQDLSMSLRMVPAAGVFQKMTRLVRDLAAKVGKDAELVLQGQETEVDKNVIEQLSDPLMHMLRNALDHGLESAQERMRAGKPPRGRILLQARQEGDEVRITVRDDGRGLDPERLLRKGIEQGLVRGDGAGLSREEIFLLIFEPGFSTAQAVTDLSGRGVGMDVVKRNVEKLKGRVEVASTPGQGTAVTIRLPLTLAIIDGMRVRVGESQYAIPMASIRETVRVAREAITRTVEGQELVMVRGSLYPVLRLHETHGITPDHTEPWEGMLVLLEHQGRTFALLVDELLGHQQTVVKALSSYLGAVPGVSGCSILGDGNVSLILDVGDLAGRARASTSSG